VNDVICVLNESESYNIFAEYFVGAENFQPQQKKSPPRYRGGLSVRVRSNKRLFT